MTLPAPQVVPPEDKVQPDGHHLPHTERVHAKVSSSKMHRLYHCLYSVQDGLDLPPEKPSEYAETGTKFHEVVEFRINDFLNHRKHGTDPNASIPEIKRNPRYTDEMLVAAEGAVESIWEHGFGRTITGKAWKTEARLHILKEPAVNGICDFLMLWVNDKGEREAYIWDYKNGVLPVEAKGNKQLLFFCVALQEMFGQEKPFEKFRVAIYQPNAMDGSPAYKESHFTQKQVEAGRSKILQIAKQVYEPELKKDGTPKKVTAKEGPGCKFCPAESICPAKKKQLRAAALMPAKKDDIVVPPVETLSEEFLTKVLTHKNQIQDFLNAVEERALGILNSGQELPGFKLVEGRSQRRMRTDLNVEETISALETLGATDCWEKKLKGVTVLEKQIGKENLEQFIYRTEPKLKVVPDGDKRQAVNPSENVRAIAAEASGTEAPKAKTKTKAKSKAKGKRKTIGKSKIAAAKKKGNE